MGQIHPINEFLEWYRKPANYRPDLPRTNRSHKYELAVIMSKKDYMASFEVTTNLEYDLLVINSIDEAIVFNKSKKLNNIQELFAELKSDYNAFAEQ